ncbi:sugar ABC transporter permease [Streptococcus suis]|uniref:Maltodextrin transport system permease protein MalD n=4 Tax=Streptococcus suis TaxID=1307 RepID=A0A0H3MYL5_STRS4|nr:sugar ABC transporter permease [Streptococcus suis]ADV71130.1 maltose/maltodextrin ABC transport system permease protein [Streptococcus suis JS14]AEB82377.1 maltose/maltodextrin ABC transport system permease protein [Streptococcus suis ST3]AER16229.1 maltose/maltodextrin ABC transport system permease protein [Streptococcus suis SS12]AER18296.1 maltose/maltodextrin ABC transport system permease protein [Streptococcus suis D9]AER45261.1 maltose/maltodextrin ABC transport system permease prote
MKVSVKTRRILNQTLTYLYLIVLSVIIIYPLLITIMSAFKSGNVVAFKLDSNINFTLDNFSKLFSETLYGTWYFNTLIIALLTMVIQTSIVVLAGYAYSRYNFIARKQSLVFFLIIQMVPTMAALTAFFVMALMLNALNQSWFLIFLYVGGGIPMNAWLMKGYFDTVPISLDESAKLDGAGHFRRFWQIVLPLVRPMIAVQALWAFMGPFGDYILSKFLLREKEFYTVAVGLQTFISDVKNMKIAYFAAGAILIALPISILFFFLQKNFVSGLTSGGDKG